MHERDGDKLPGGKVWLGYDLEAELLNQGNRLRSHCNRSIINGKKDY